MYERKVRIPPLVMKVTLFIAAVFLCLLMTAQPAKAAEVIASGSYKAGPNLSFTISWSLTDDYTLSVGSYSSGNYADFHGPESGTNPYAAYKNVVKKIVFSQNISRWGQNIDASCFNGFTALEEIVFPPTIQVLKGFNNCTALKRVELPQVNFLHGAFNYCTSLEKALLWGGKPTELKASFQNTTDINTVVYTNGGWTGIPMISGSTTTMGGIWKTRFLDYDGSVIKDYEYTLSDEAAIPPTEDPVRESENRFFSYIFDCWTPDPTLPRTGNTDYIATYNSVPRSYTIEWRDWDDRIIGRDNCFYGNLIVPPTDPTRPDDERNTYTFVGWVDEEGNPFDDSGTVTEDAVYTAQYSSSSRTYEVKFVSDGEVISSTPYTYGATVTEPATPTKAQDNTYTYTFAGWDKEVAATCTGDVTYVAQFTPVYRNYSVVFMDWDDTVLLEKHDYHWGSSITIPPNPTRNATDSTVYSFSGWSPAIQATVAGDITYVAQYAENATEYTVTFQDWNGYVISSGTYAYGAAVSAPSDPTRAEDDTYTYEFAGWSPRVGDTVTGSTLYIAQYTPTFKEYTVTFVDHDDTVLSKKTDYHWKDAVILPNSDPTRDADERYEYEFSGWSPAVDYAVRGTATYKAQYLKTARMYSVTFKDWNGRVLGSGTYQYGQAIVAPTDPTRPDDATNYTFTGWEDESGNPLAATATKDTVYMAQYSSSDRTYEIKFVSDGMVVSKVNYAYGAAIVPPDDPSKEQDNTYAYEFAGWVDEGGNLVDSFATVAGNATYVAQFTPVYRNYSVVFTDWNNDVLLEKHDYHWGQTVILPNSDPTRDADERYEYEFSGWSPAPNTVWGNATHKAQYSRTNRIYNVSFQDWNGRVLGSGAYQYGQAIVAPTNPTRPDDATNYIFTGWEDENGEPLAATATKDAVYTAQYSSSDRTYEVKFISDGVVISRADYTYGAAIVPPDDPEKEQDNTYTYEFAGWDKQVADTCMGDATYVAQFTPVYRNYSVVFKDWNDDVLLEKHDYHWGSSITIPPNPTRNATDSTVYSFSGWSPAIQATVAGDVTYVAQYAENATECTITFQDWNGNVISSRTYAYGAAVEVPDDPTRAEDGYRTYTFTGWTPEVVTTAVGDATYSATYSTQEKQYTIVFEDWDGTVILSRTYGYDELVEIPDDPEREEDESYTYSFTGWNYNVIPTVTRDMTYRARYSKTPKIYSVTFKNYDGSLLHLNTNCRWGEAVYQPTIFPAPPSDNEQDYVNVFSHWSTTNDSVNDFSPTVNGNAVYIAQFERQYVDYTITFRNSDGTILSQETYHWNDTVVEPGTPSMGDNTYTYTFAGWNKPISVVNSDAEYTATYHKEYINYTVGFKDWDGSTIFVREDYHYGENIVIPDAPTREPLLDDNDVVMTTYSFIGWERVDRSEEGISGVVTGNAIYVARYAENPQSHIITFVDWNGREISSAEYDYGSQINIPSDPQREDDNIYRYTFNEWSPTVSSTCVGGAVYVATYTPTYREYTVKFVDWDSTEFTTMTQQCHWGDIVGNLFVPTRPSDGETVYVFTGWSPSFSEICTGDVTYTAQYRATPKTYTVKFFDHDGALLFVKSDYVSGDQLVLPSEPQREANEVYEYTFTGWSPDVAYTVTTDAEYTAVYSQSLVEYTVTFQDWDGREISSQTYHWGDFVVAPSAPTRPDDVVYTYRFTGWSGDVSAPVSGNVTYTALYQPTYREYTVTFQDWDGREISSRTYHYNDPVVIPENPVRDGDGANIYSFSGWLPNVETTVTGTATYTATYSVTPCHTVTFVDHDGATLKTEVVNHGEDATAPADPVREGYTFTGWDVAFDNVTSNLTVTAQYTINSYTVTFVDHDGTVLKTETVNHGEDATAPSDPVWVGHSFTGWDKGFSNITADITVTAMYDTVTYTVTFKDWDGTVLSTQTIAHGGAASAPVVPAREGYTFTGWDVAFDNVTSDIEVTAQYQLSTYTVTFVDHDGTVLKTETVTHGDVATAPANPTRASDSSYTYTFAGWVDEEGHSFNASAPVSEGATYTAAYTATPVQGGGAGGSGSNPGGDSGSNNPGGGSSSGGSSGSGGSGGGSWGGGSWDDGSSSSGSNSGSSGGNLTDEPSSNQPDDGKNPDGEKPDGEDGEKTEDEESEEEKSEDKSDEKSEEEESEGSKEGENSQEAEGTPSGEGSGDSNEVGDGVADGNTDANNNGSNGGNGSSSSNNSGSGFGSGSIGGNESGNQNDNEGGHVEKMIAFVDPFGKVVYSYSGDASNLVLPDAEEYIFIDNEKYKFAGWVLTDDDEAGMVYKAEYILVQESVEPDDPDSEDQEVFGEVIPSGDEDPADEAKQEENGLSDSVKTVGAVVGTISLAGIGFWLWRAYRFKKYGY